MTTITITRPATCKDCAYLLQVRHGKQKRHKCSNETSNNYDLPITLKTPVCEVWALEKK